MIEKEGCIFFFFSSRRRHTRWPRDWSSDVCSSDLTTALKDNEVVLLEWPENPLRNLPAGTNLTLTYFNPDVEGEGKLESAELTLRGYNLLAGAARDRDLTPTIR